jgi:hypothetical protein
MALLRAHMAHGVQPGGRTAQDGSTFGFRLSNQCSRGGHKGVVLDIASDCDSKGVGEPAEAVRMLSGVVRESRLQKHECE